MSSAMPIMDNIMPATNTKNLLRMSSHPLFRTVRWLHGDSRLPISEDLRKEFRRPP